MRRLIVIAHPLEAREIERYPELGAVVISGMGSLCSAIATAKHATDFDEVWNLGVAGALHCGVEVGSMARIQVVERLVPAPEATARAKSVSAFCHPPLCLAESGWRLVSTDVPVHTASERERLGSHYDVVDMEGYGVAKAALACGKPCTLWKVVSDICTDASHIAERVPQLMQSLLLALAPTSL